jgi:glycosyltransferase involved in cell wall biosynthesis
VEPGLARVYALSQLLAVSGDPAHLIALHKEVWQPGYTLEQRHFFYWQRIIKHSAIQAPGLEPAALYDQLLQSARQEVGLPAPWVPPHERDPDRIIVITNQLLTLAHAPTADCMDYCYLLQTRLKKKIFLINTADMPWNLDLPYYEPVRFNHLEEYSKVGTITYKDEGGIAFYQCKQPMPNIKEMRSIVGTVLTQKPSFVLSLGHSNVAPDLCADYITVATMPFGTNLPQARSNLYVLPRARKPQDAAFMQQWGIGDEQIIEAPYTFRLPERTATLTRGGLGLPEDAYVIAVVGNRLDSEVTDAVAGELATFLSAVPQAFVAFFGTFPGYASLVARHPQLAGRSAFLGHQPDVLAVFEHCDAYYNPPRWGGGSSAAFALAMGVPVLTQDGGDVANIAGPRFHFASADAMLEFIRHSQRDPEHRREWAAAARARFAEVSDRESMLRHIVEQAAARADLRTRSRA